MAVWGLGCSCGLLATALLGLLLVPVQYSLPKGELPPPALPVPPLSRLAWLQLYSPPFELLGSIVLSLLAFLVYLCGWVQMKIMEKRLLKLSRHLGAKVERLRAYEARREQQEAVRRLVRHATDEYNLLLHLAQKQYCAAAPRPDTKRFIKPERMEII